MNTALNNDVAAFVPKSLRAIGAPRASTAKYRKPHRRPNQAIAMRKRWADPEYRAKQIEGRQQTALDRARHPDRYSRAGIPNGMRKADSPKATVRKPFKRTEDHRLVSACNMKLLLGAVHELH